MDEGQLGLYIFASICIVCAILLHWRIQSYWLATIVSTVVSVILFQVIAYIDLGYLDPFFIIAMVTSSAAAFAISVFVGAFFTKHRHKQKEAQ